MKQIGRKEAIELVLEAIGWSNPPTTVRERIDRSPRALSSLIRRASGLLGGCREYHLQDYVYWPLQTLIDPELRSEESVRGHISRVIEDLTNTSELISATELINGRRTTFIYPGEPRFIRRRIGDIMILGTLPEHINPLPKDLADDLDHHGYLRFLPDKHYETLKALDYFKEISEDMWMESPIDVDPVEYFIKMVNRVKAAPPYGGDLSFERLYRHLSGVPKTRYGHLNLWKDWIPKDAGFYIVNFRDNLGARYWAFAKTQDGNIERCIFLPSDPGALSGKFEAADEARRIQLAYDYWKETQDKSKTRQIAKVERDDTGGGLIKVYAPLPSWVDRRWSVLGEKLPSPLPQRNHDCLFAWLFQKSEFDTEIEFARSKVWLKVEDEQNPESSDAD